MRRFGLILSLAAVVFLTAASAMAERRLALVVGNSAYKNTPSLANPKNDAGAMAEALKRLGFKVIRGIDLSADGMRKTVREFADALQSADVALFYYAGHGLQVNGQNYLVPVDAKMRSSLDLEFEATNLQVVIDLMEREETTNLVFLDACRDNPLARTLARSLGSSRSTTIGQGLARIESGIGTLIAYATEPGNVALDGDGRHSPFTAALLQHISTPGLEVGRMLRRVRRTVLKKTRRKQVPWDHSSLIGDFYFGSRPAIASVRPAAPPLPASPAITAPSPNIIEVNLQLTREERVLVQRALNSLKHGAGTDDGLFGLRSRKAIRRYQSAMGEPETGYLSAKQAKALIEDGKKRVAMRPRPIVEKITPAVKISVEPSPRPASTEATPAPKLPAAPATKMATLSPQPKVVQPNPRPTTTLAEGLNGEEIKALLIGNTLETKFIRTLNNGQEGYFYAWIFYKDSSTKITKFEIESLDRDGFKRIREKEPFKRTWRIEEDRMICGINKSGRELCRKNVRVSGETVKMDGVKDVTDRIYKIHKGNIKNL